MERFSIYKTESPCHNLCINMRILRTAGVLAMFLHLGCGISVNIRDIIGIFDLDNASTSRITRDFLQAAEQDGMVIPVGSELPKSLVVCCPAGSWQRVYISPLAPATLLGRLNSILSTFSLL